MKPTMNPGTLKTLKNFNSYNFQAKSSSLQPFLKADINLTYQWKQQNSFYLLKFGLSIDLKSQISMHLAILQKYSCSHYSEIYLFNENILLQLRIKQSISH